MAALDWSQCPAVESIPGKVNGAWVQGDTAPRRHSDREPRRPQCRRGHGAVRRDSRTDHSRARIRRPEPPRRPRPRRCLASLTTARRRGPPRCGQGTLSTQRSPEAGDTVSNGDLLCAAEEAGFDVRLSTDRRIRYQQKPLCAPNCARRADRQHQVVARTAACGAHRHRRCGSELWQLHRSRDTCRQDLTEVEPCRPCRSSEDLDALHCIELAAGSIPACECEVERH